MNWKLNDLPVSFLFDDGEFRTVSSKCESGTVLDRFDELFNDDDIDGNFVGNIGSFNIGVIGGSFLG